MFNEIHRLNATEDKSILLAFVKSVNIQAYPCGRRRSVPIDNDNAAVTTIDQYHIPFDPEARLNTERNSRRHSSVNGFNSSFLKTWDVANEKLTLSLDGYVFDIDLRVRDKQVATAYLEVNQFCSKLVELLNIADADAIVSLDKRANKIYANIRLEEVPLYEGTFKDYNTWVLRNQSDTAEAAPQLDLVATLNNDGAVADRSTPENFYFSGLSFSIDPITEESTKTRSEKYLKSASGRNQKVISLCLFKKNATGEWVINPQAGLPNIEHGNTEDSVKINDLQVTSITAGGVQLVGTNDANRPVIIGRVPALVATRTGSNTYKLQFYFGKNIPLGDDWTEDEVSNLLDVGRLDYLVLG